MRAIIAFALLLFPLSGQAAVVRVTIEEVAKKVSTQNYLVLENAERVYQAKEAIQVARGNLLPKLNLWKVAGVICDPRSVVGLLEDVAPFLVPANWFRVKQQKLLLEAQREAYRTLWGNEIMTAKMLYLQTLLDQSLLEHVLEQRNELERLLVIVGSRETLGGAPEGTSRDIEIRMLSLKEDERALQALISEEKSFLAYIIGLGGQAELELTQIGFPTRGELKPLSYGDYEERVLSVSSELKQFDQLVKVAESVKREIPFYFLGASSMSRGAGGGIFDALPVQDGLGFGTGASMRIAKKEKAILRLQRQGVQEVLKRRLKTLVTEYNLDIDHYQSLSRRLELTDLSSRRLSERLLLGETVDALTLVEASRNHAQASTAFFGIQYRFLMNHERLARLIGQGDYEGRPAEMDEMRGN
jgi:outer membrane protein, multidrug efflux system